MDEQNILKFFKANTDLMNILRIIRDLKLKDSWLAAGSVRNFIWNILSNQPGFDADPDDGSMQGLLELGDGIVVAFGLLPGFVTAGCFVSVEV